MQYCRALGTGCYRVSSGRYCHGFWSYQHLSVTIIKILNDFWKFIDNLTVTLLCLQVCDFSENHWKPASITHSFLQSHLGNSCVCMRALLYQWLGPFYQRLLKETHQHKGQSSEYAKSEGELLNIVAFGNYLDQIRMNWLICI